MQSKDIKVGEEYAYRAYPSNRHVERVKVLAVGVERKDRGYSGRITKVVKGQVEVKFLGKDYAKGTTGIVAPATIVRPWAEEAEAQAYDRAARERSIASMKAARAKIESLLPPEFFDNGERPDAEYDESPGILSYRFEAEVFPDGSYSTEDRLSIHDLATLLQAAYDKGCQDTSA